MTIRTKAINVIATQFKNMLDEAQSIEKAHMNSECKFNNVEAEGRLGTSSWQRLVMNWS